MTCPICKTGELEPGTTQLTLTRDGTTVVTTGIPADVCDNCGEAYIGAAVTEQLQVAFERAHADRVSVSVREYQAA